MRKLQPKIIAFLLILVLSQKLGLGLWMHNWFHENNSAQSSKSPALQNIHLLCQCIDDTLMPLTESSIITVTDPLRICTVIEVNYRSPFSFAEKLFYSLKGPPALFISSVV